MATIKANREKEREKFPVLYKIGVGREAQFFVSVDLLLLEVHGNITVALCTLMQTFFCFNIQYPSRGQAFYRLLETILGINTFTRAPFWKKLLKKFPLLPFVNKRRIFFFKFF